MIADLPVGYNLQEHASSVIVFTLNESVGFNFIDFISSVTLLEYYAAKSNVLTSNYAEGIGFINTKYANASDDRPDIEFHTLSGIYLKKY